MTTEERLQRLERQGRMYRHLFILAALSLVVLVSFGAEPESLEKKIASVESEQLDTAIELAKLKLRLRKGTLDVIRARRFLVMNKSNVVVGQLSEVSGAAFLGMYKSNERSIGKVLVAISTLPSRGFVSVFGGSKSKASLVGSNDDNTGGWIFLNNKTGETVVQLEADEYGNGLVGAYNRKGMGRTLQPGPQ